MKNKLNKCENDRNTNTGGGWYMLGVQSLSVLCLVSWSILTNFVLLWTINKIIPIRMDPNEELLGADLVEHHIRHAQVGVSRAMSALKPFVAEEQLDKVTTIGYNPGHDSYIETNFFNNNLPLEIRPTFTGNKRSKTAVNNGNNALAALKTTKKDNFQPKYAWLD